MGVRSLPRPCCCGAGLRQDCLRASRQPHRRQLLPARSAACCAVPDAPPSAPPRRRRASRTTSSTRSDRWWDKSAADFKQSIEEQNAKWRELNARNEKAAKDAAAASREAADAFKNLSNTRMVEGRQVCETGSQRFARLPDRGRNALSQQGLRDRQERRYHDQPQMFDPRHAAPRRQRMQSRNRDDQGGVPVGIRSANPDFPSDGRRAISASS